MDDAEASRGPGQHISSTAPVFVRSSRAHPHQPGDRFPRFAKAAAVGMADLEPGWYLERYVIAGEISFLVGDQRIEATAGDFVFAPKDVPHAFLVNSDRAEYLASFSPAGAERFFREVAPRVVPGEPAPPPSEPDPEEFARIAASYGIEIVGPPPTLD